MIRGLTYLHVQHLFFCSSDLIVLTVTLDLVYLISSRDTVLNMKRIPSDRCNDYVKAWKRLTVRRAPNILTIALKRFQVFQMPLFELHLTV